ncbi:MAG: diaminopimelate decarboxylase [Candidatus Ozemobacteraceae bacterium]
MIDYARCAAEFGTPLYVYDAVEIRRRIRLAREVFADLDVRLFYAAKANNNPHLLAVMRQEGVGADVVSTGELASAGRAGVSELLLNGNGKTPALARAFIEARGSFVSLDNPAELRLWRDAPMKRLLRINPDVVAGGHRFIATGGRAHKFGVSADRIPEILGHLDGLHVHIGSQILESEPFLEAYTIAVRLANLYKFRLLDIGGGWGIRYEPSEQDLDLEKFRRQVVIPVLKPFNGTLLVELGRWIVAAAGSLLVQVIDIKQTEKTFVVVDAGMNALIRPMLYDAWHKIESLSPKNRSVVCDIVGPLCETGDILAHDRELTVPDPGDILRVSNAGAYGYSMANTYNGMPRPAEVLVDGDRITLIRRRETIDDLFAGCPSVESHP